MDKNFIHFSLNDPNNHELTYDSNWSNVFFDMCLRSGILEVFERENTKIVYIDINSFSHWLVSYSSNKRKEVFKMLFDRNLGNINYKEYKFIISYIGEARAYFEADTLINLLKLFGVADNQIHLLLSTVKEIISDYRCVSFWEFFLRNPFGAGDFEKYLEDTSLECYNHRDTAPKKHFLCLMRRIKLDRLLFYNQMVDYKWFNNKKIIDISLGSSAEPNQFQIGPQEALLKENLIPSLPIIWDTYPVNDDTQHSFLKNQNINQLVNVVVETFIIVNEVHYGGIFITEKSIKPFFYYQMPIFVGQNGLVKLMRSLGYDLFDDYFENHYYDEIENPYVRMKEILKIMDRFIKKYPNEELGELKKNILPRLDHNLLVARNFSEKEYFKTFNKKMSLLIGYNNLL